MIIVCINEYVNIHTVLIRMSKTRSNISLKLDLINVIVWKLCWEDNEKTKLESKVYSFIKEHTLQNLDFNMYLS